MTNVFKVVCLVCAVTLCCSCAPNLKNLKEVDCYIEEQRTSTTRPVYIDIDSPLKTRVSIANIITFPFSLIHLLKPGPLDRKGNVRSYAAVSGSIDFQRYVVISRQEPGKPEWNLREEVFKKAGPVPSYPSCEVKVFSFEPIMGFNKEYNFGDSHVKVANGILFQLHFNRKKGAEPPCNAEAAHAYISYVYKVTHILMSYADEAFSRPSPHCPNDCP